MMVRRAKIDNLTAMPPTSHNYDHVANHLTSCSVEEIPAAAGGTGGIGCEGREKHHEEE